MKRIGLFGGSFDPVHTGHVRLAEAALDELNLDKVVFIPAARSPFKGKPAASDSRRLALLRRALGKQKRFELSREELMRGGASYTIDTVRRYRRGPGKRAALYFLCGADQAKGLRHWKSFPALAKLCRFAVFSRPGHRLDGMPDGVIRVPFDALPVSSTEIRRLSSKRWKK